MALVTLYWLAGLLAFVRGDFLRPEAQQRYSAWSWLDKLPHWSLAEWAVIPLAATILLMIEGVYRWEQRWTKVLAPFLNAAEAERERAERRVVLLDFLSEGERLRDECVPPRPTTQGEADEWAGRVQERLAEYKPEWAKLFTITTGIQGIAKYPNEPRGRVLNFLHFRLTRLHEIIGELGPSAASLPVEQPALKR